jgi:hypothetical protein
MGSDRDPEENEISVRKTVGQLKKPGSIADPDIESVRGDPPT